MAMASAELKYFKTLGNNKCLCFPADMTAYEARFLGAALRLENPPIIENLHISLFR